MESSNDVFCAALQSVFFFKTQTNVSVGKLIHTLKMSENRT